MTHPHVKIKKVIRLCELVDNKGLLKNYEFRDCHIKGPAILVFTNSSLIGNKIRGGIDAVLWEIPSSHTHIVGAIWAKNCTFEGCTFDMVGLAGPPDFIKDFKAQLPESKS